MVIMHIHLANAEVKKVCEYYFIHLLSNSGFNSVETSIIFLAVVKSLIPVNMCLNVSHRCLFDCVLVNNHF